LGSEGENIHKFIGMEYQKGISSLFVCISSSNLCISSQKSPGIIILQYDNQAEKGRNEKWEK